MIILIGLITLLSNICEGFRRLTIKENNLLQKECGISNFNSTSSEEFKIINSNDVNDGDLPWAAKIIVQNDNTVSRYCTGSFISPWHIITAAHCLMYNENCTFMAIGGAACTYTVLSPFTGQLISPCASTIIPEMFLGRQYVVPKGSNKFRQKFNNSKNVIHYASDTVYTDFAIIELQRSINYEQVIRPVCLPSTKTINSLNNDEAIVYGYGATVNTTEIEASMRTFVANAKLGWFLVHKCSFGSNKCTDKENSVGYENCKRYMLAYCPLYEQYACFGDSGGGLLKIFKNKYFLYGITSKSAAYKCKSSWNYEYRKLRIEFANLEPFIEFICYHTGVCPHGYDYYKASDGIGSIYGIFKSELLNDGKKKSAIAVRKSTTYSMNYQTDQEYIEVTDIPANDLYNENGRSPVMTTTKKHMKTPTSTVRRRLNHRRKMYTKVPLYSSCNHKSSSTLLIVICAFIYAISKSVDTVSSVQSSKSLICDYELL